MSVEIFAKHFQWKTDEKTIKALEIMKKKEQAKLEKKQLKKIQKIKSEWFRDKNKKGE